MRATCAICNSELPCEHCFIAKHCKKRPPVACVCESCSKEKFLWKLVEMFEKGAS